MSDASLKLIETIIQGILIGSVYALFATGLNMIFGTMKIINFAHGDLVMIPMYVTFWLYTLWGVDHLASIPINALLMFVVGVLIYRFLISKIIGTPVFNQLLLTVAISLVFTNTALLIWKADYRFARPDYVIGSFSLAFLDMSFGRARVIAFVVATIISVIFFIFITRTITGKSIRATSQNLSSANLMGIDTNKSYIITFGLGAALAGIAGSILSLYHPVFPTVGLMFGLRGFLIVVIGGMGSYIGSFVGGLLLGITEVSTSVYIGSAYKEIVPFIVFIFILIYRPWGLFGRSHL